MMCAFVDNPTCMKHSLFIHYYLIRSWGLWMVKYILGFFFKGKLYRVGNLSFFLIMFGLMMDLDFLHLFVMSLTRFLSYFGVTGFPLWMIFGLDEVFPCSLIWWVVILLVDCNFDPYDSGNL